jgi:hypothetical protein
MERTAMVSTSRMSFTAYRLTGIPAYRLTNSRQNVPLMLKCTSPIDSPLRRSSLKP